MDWQAILLAIITAVPPTLVAAAAYVQASKTHKAVNSRMDLLLEIATSNASAKATLEEKRAEGVRKGELAIEAAKPSQ